jgi:hypothetical protein
MEHILIECRHSLERKTLWRLARKLWRNKGRRWSRLTIGSVLASRALQFARNDRQEGDAEALMKMSGPSRLLQILVSETAHLIWAI